MRRHPDRLSTTCDEFLFQGFRRRPERKLKRGPKNRQRRWPLLHYTIEPGVGVVFKEEE